MIYYPQLLGMSVSVGLEAQWDIVTVLFALDSQLNLLVVIHNANALIVPSIPEGFAAWFVSWLRGGMNSETGKHELSLRNFFGFRLEKYIWLFLEFVKTQWKEVEQWRKNGQNLNLSASIAADQKKRY